MVSCLRHRADKTRIGVNLLHDKDVDGKEFVKERVEACQDRAELLIELQVREPGDQDRRAEANVLRAAHDSVVCGGVYQS